MLRSVVLALVIMLTGADAARAGAWLREQGKGFVSTSIDVNRDMDVAASSYFEYGLRSRTTVGADLNFWRGADGGRTGYAGLFLRRPLGRTDRNAKWAWQVGAGAIWDADRISPYVETGLSFGRGLTLAGRHGWIAIDGKIKWDTATAEPTAKLDTTLGIAINDQFKVMAQVFVTRDPAGTVTTLAPSLLYKPKNRDFTVQLGAELRSTRQGGAALKLGLWRNF